MRGKLGQEDVPRRVGIQRYRENATGSDVPLAPELKLRLAPESLWFTKILTSEVDLNGGRLNSLAADAGHFTLPISSRRMSGNPCSRSLNNTVCYLTLAPKSQ